jgi:hypothetical protein
VTQEGSSTQALVDLGQVCRGISQANPGIVNPEARCRAASGEASDPMLPRKTSSEWTRCPYPKPTQVGT